MKPKRCDWFVGWGYKCGAPATHFCPRSDGFLCLDHSDDWKEVFGEDSLREIPIQEESQ